MPNLETPGIALIDCTASSSSLKVFQFIVSIQNIFETHVINIGYIKFFAEIVQLLLCQSRKVELKYPLCKKCVAGKSDMISTIRKYVNLNYNMIVHFYCNILYLTFFEKSNVKCHACQYIKIKFRKYFYILKICIKYMNI